MQSPNKYYKKGNSLVNTVVPPGSPQRVDVSSAFFYPNHLPFSSDSYPYMLKTAKEYKETSNR